MPWLSWSPLVLFLVVVALPVMMVHQVVAADTSNETETNFNITVVEEEYYNYEDEFLMESQTSNRRILGPSSNNIYPSVREPNTPFCDQKVHGSCSKINKYSTKLRYCPHATYCADRGKY